MDLTSQTGQRKMGDKPPEKKTINLQAAQAQIEQQETMRLRDLKGRLDAAIEASPTLRAFKNQIRVELHAGRPAHPGHRRAEPIHFRHRLSNAQGLHA